MFSQKGHPKILPMERWFFFFMNGSGLQGERNISLHEKENTAPYCIQVCHSGGKLSKNN